MKYVALTLSLILFVSVFFINNKNHENVLLVGTNAEYAPYTFVQNDSIVGFDIDVAEELCKRLGKTMKLIDMPFDALLIQLGLNRVDFIAAGMSPTDERKKKVSFSRILLEPEPLVLVALSEDALNRDLSSQKVVVNEGFVAEGWVLTEVKVEPLRLLAVHDALLALKSKRADVFVTAKSTTRLLGKEFFISPPVSKPSDGVALVVAKDNEQLLFEMNIMLEQMEKEGFLQKIREKWGFL